MNNHTSISARGIRKVFGQGALAFEALKGVDFQVQKGEFLMLAGPSGSGKTTLLSILGCVLSPTEGEVYLEHERVSSLPEAELPRIRTQYIGFIFQGHNLIASLTAEQNIALQLELRGIGSREALVEARDLLDKVGLPDKFNRKPNELSGGQRQRVAVARAMAGNPPIILADEPTAALDAENGRLITELLRQLCRERGHSVVVVTHDNRIFHLADRMVYIEDGRIQEALS
jgi:putative ABC transport system ATP-binding protein